MDVNRFLYDEKGKPRVSIFSIAHLSDNERMFFVTMLLNEVLSWVRSQSGTGSLRAILYMDELFGYLPPTANPPSKAPLLTLLKQARAFGLGLVLSTQNPVDLDYKALSNAGTWFIGRLQAERDKERVLAGLEGAAAGGKFDRQRTAQILAGLSQPIFYLHNVHEDEPVIFSTRWTLSYLAGPMTREQISLLPDNHGTAQTIDSVSYNSAPKQNIENLNSASPVCIGIRLTPHHLFPPSCNALHILFMTSPMSSFHFARRRIGYSRSWFPHGLSAHRFVALLMPTAGIASHH